MEKYVNDERLQQSLAAVRDRLAIKDKTEAQALVLSSTYPNCVYYTSDTHCIVIGGNIYGRGTQVMNAFTIAPSGAIPGDPDFSDTTRIYLQPQTPGPDFDLWYYDTVGQQWVNFGTFDAGVATSASDISYDLTSTPDLGTGDVQSAIEALDGNVEAVAARIDDEKVEFIKARFPMQSLGIYTLGLLNTNISITHDNGIITLISGSDANSYIRWTKLIVPKGTLLRWNRQKSTATATDCFGYSIASPQEYFENNDTLVGFTFKELAWYTADDTYVEHYAIMPEDGYVLYRYYNTNNSVNAFYAYDASFEGNVDAVVKPDKMELIKHMPIGGSGYNGVTFNHETYVGNTSIGDTGKYDRRFYKLSGSTNASWHLYWAYTPIAKDTVVNVKLSRNGTQELTLYYSTESPQEYASAHSSSIAGFTAKYLTSSTSTDVNMYAMMPEDGYILIRQYIGTERTDLGEGLSVDFYSLEMLTRLHDYNIEFIKNWMPYGGNISSVYGQTARDNTSFTINSSGLAVVSGSSVNTRYTTKQVPKGTLVRFVAKYNSSTTYYSAFKVSYVYESPTEYYSAHSSTLAGMELDGVIYNYWRDNPVDYWFIMPETAYLIWSGAHAYSCQMTLYVYPSDPFKEWYSKGVADGAGMASIAGLGYNVYDYISGEIDLEGFEYGCRYRHNSIFTPITGTGNKKWQNNTHLVYFPKVDLTELDPSGYYSFAGCSNLEVVPDLNFSEGSAQARNMFDNCKKLKHVGNITGLKPTTVLYMFNACNVLVSVGKIDTSQVSASDGFHYIFNSCNVVERCEGLDLTSAPNIGQDTFYYKSNRPTMRYFLLTNLGKNRANTIFNMTRTTNWGVATASQPDARQSVIDTLITYSFDRAQANEDAKQAAIDAGTYDEETWTDPYGVITISLAANTKALLTDEEIEQITAKGYTIA